MPVKRKMVLLLLLGILFLIGGLDTASRGINDVFGSDYPRIIQYNGNQAEGQLQVLGNIYSLSPEASTVVEQIASLPRQLEGFLETIEDLVKKYGRQTQQMMRELTSI